MSTLKCVRCSGTLTKASYEKVVIDTCPRCGGVWLDPGELESIVSTKQEKFSKDQVTQTLRTAAAGVPKAEIESKEHCPKCSALLTAVNYNYGSGIVIDLCPQGHGVWLDMGELEKLQIHMEHWDEKALASGWKDTLAKANAEHKSWKAAEQNKFESSLGAIGRIVARTAALLKK